MALSGNAIGSVVDDLASGSYTDSQVCAVLKALNTAINEDGAEAQSKDFEEELATLLLKTKSLKHETVVEAVRLAYNCR